MAARHDSEGETTVEDPQSSLEVYDKIARVKHGPNMLRLSEETMESPMIAP